MLQVDKGTIPQPERIMTTLIAFAVLIVVAAAANTALNPRMPN